MAIGRRTRRVRNRGHGDAGVHAGEAVRYLNNALAILRRVPVEREIHLDREPVREARGAASLAVLEAINEVLGRRGVARRGVAEIRRMRTVRLSGATW
jgi:hypothetical protein